jgi:lipopolysaccharide/colanic/teichoic acid biosynthesis glycosyltransferase
MRRASILLKLWFPLALGLAFLAAVYIRFYSGLIPVEDAPLWPAYTAYFALSAALWSALEIRFRIIHRCFQAPSLGRWLWSLAQLDLLTLALVSSAAFFWRGYSFSRYTVALFWALHLLLSLPAAWAARAWARRQAATWIFLIGDGLDPERLRQECLPAGAEYRCRQLGSAAEALEALENLPPAECRDVLVAVSAAQAADLPALAEALNRLAIPAALALEGLHFSDAQATPSFMILSNEPRTAEAFDYVFSKRLLDLALSLAGLAVLGPLMAAIAAVSLRRSGRPVLLAQERVGAGGRRFRLYKFRTLPVSSLADGDRRWTPPPTDGWGRFLRATGLDELPQLFNVLKGEMSLVGPRPERPHFVEQFRRQLPFYSTRHRLRAGITGWAQVNGWRGDTSISRRVEHDLYYLHHWSLLLDLKILWMTAAGFFHHLRVAVAAARGTPDAGSV